MASNYNSRKFNLIPPRTKEEEMVFEERDNSFFYSFILIFCAAVVFFFLTLAQTLIIDPRVSSTQSSIDNINNQIAGFSSLKAVNGELYIKSQALESLLAQDIKLTELLEISSKLKDNITNAQIIAYNRESSGMFVIDLRLDSFTDINQVFVNSETITEVEDLTLRTIGKQDVSGITYITATLAFNINNINQDAQ